MDQDKFSLLKSHVEQYTRSDGTVVQAHDDKRVAAAPKASDGGSSPLLQAKSEARAASEEAMKTGDKDDHATAFDKHTMAAYYSEKAGHPTKEHEDAREVHKAGMMANTAPQTKSKNEDWGFHGEAITQHLRDKHGPENYYRNATEQDHKDAKSAASKKFSDAAHKLVQAGHFDKHEQARDYLDATHGRHLHDAAPDGDVAKVPWLAKDVKAFKRKTGSTGA